MISRCQLCIEFSLLLSRGAAGRLMRLEDTQLLLDDFGIPLQISCSSDSKEKDAFCIHSSNVHQLNVCVQY